MNRFKCALVIACLLLYGSACVHKPIANRSLQSTITKEQPENKTIAPREEFADSLIIEIQFIIFYPAKLKDVIGEENILHWLYKNRYDSYGSGQPILYRTEDAYVKKGTYVYRKIIDEINKDFAKCKCGIQVEFLRNAEREGYLYFSLKDK